jgi:peptidoglycan/LPS O-acetylase OafA/YrhL
LPTSPVWSGAIAAATVITIILLPRYLLENQYQLYAIVGVLLPALFDFSRRVKSDRWLGDLSYPLYLVHWPVAAFAAAITRTIQPGAMGTVVAYPIFALTLAIALSICINRYIVDPIDEWRQRRATDEAGSKDGSRAAVAPSLGAPV